MSHTGRLLGGFLLLFLATACAPEVSDTTVTTTGVGSSVAAATSTAVPSPTTLPSPTTTTMAHLVTLTLSPGEALATGGGIAIEVTVDGEAVAVLSAEDAGASIAVADGGTVGFAYRAADGSDAGVAWEQVADGDEMQVAQPWRSEDTVAGDIVLVWQALGTTSDYTRQLDAAPGVTVVAPIWWQVLADGTIGDSADQAYVDAVHDRGVAIWPAVAGLDAGANHALLSDPRARTAAASQISERARLIGADGVNIDIEGFREEDAPAFLAWVEELVGLVHAWGGKVSYDLIPRTDSWDVGPEELAYWSTAPPRRELAALVDFTVLMAYDQYNRYRPAGPVAAPGWVEDGLRYLLRYADPHTVVLGIPFYGRVWDPAELDRPRALGVGSIGRLAESGTATFDEQHGLDLVTLDDGRFLWLEDAGLLRERLDLVEEYGLAGWAGWRLGLDSGALWAELAR